MLLVFRQLSDNRRSLTVLGMLCAAILLLIFSTYFPSKYTTIFLNHKHVKYAL